VHRAYVLLVCRKFWFFVFIFLEGSCSKSAGTSLLYGVAAFMRRYLCKYMPSIYCSLFIYHLFVTY
jgi:hypothetical protein